MSAPGITSEKCFNKLDFSELGPPLTLQHKQSAIIQNIPNILRFKLNDLCLIDYTACTLVVFNSPTLNGLLNN